MAKSPRRRKRSGFAMQQQLAMGMLFLLGALFGVAALTGGIQMLLNGETSASYSTAKAGVPYRIQGGFGPFTPLVLGCVLLAICVLVLLKRLQTKGRRRRN